MEDHRASFPHSYRTASLSLGLQGVPLLSGRSSLCLQKRGKGLVESFCVHELLRVLDLHISARVFIHTTTDD